MTTTFDYNDVENFLPPSIELLQSVPSGHWVAVSKDRKRVVASGEDLMQVSAEAERLGEEVMFAKNPPSWGNHAF